MTDALCVPFLEKQIAGFGTLRVGRPCAMRQLPSGIQRVQQRQWRKGHAVTRDHKIFAMGAAGGVLALLAGMLALSGLILLSAHGAMAVGSIG